MTDQWPALVQTSGQQAGAFFPVRADGIIIGRDPQADIRLPSPVVGRHHARISREGVDLVVEDLRSLNGTFVNGVRVDGTAVLRPDDTLRVADIELLYVLPGAHPIRDSEPTTDSQTYGDVEGPVNTGNPVNQGGSQIVGSGSIYQGNVHQGDRIEVDGDEGLEELFSGRGPGRALMVIGLVVALAGFAVFANVVFSFATGFGTAEPDFTSPFDKEILGLNAVATGFALFVGGGLLTSIGQGMSRAARKRETGKNP